MATGETFAADIEKWVAKAKANMDKVARVSIQRMCFNVVVDTPLHIGFLRGSWQPSIGAPDYASTGTADIGGTKVMAEIAIKIVNLKLGQVFYMTNNAAYAMRVHYGFVGTDSLGRNYNQKGQPWVSNNLSRWQSIVQTVALEVAKS